MKNFLINFLKPTGLLVLACFTSSCWNLKPTSREFQSHALYEPADFVDTDPEGEPVAKATPKEPDFQQLKFDKRIKSSDLQAPSGPYRVGPGDILSIEVAENAATQQKTKVMPDGMLYYDVANGVNVKGLTLKEISTKLSHALKEDYVNPVVTVNIDTPDSQRFWMLGQVRKPGAYAIKKPTTLVDAISLGEGLVGASQDEVGNPEPADLERAIMIRNGELIPVDFEALVHEGDLSQNVYVKGGDYIHIPSSAARSIYVLGEVSRPGPIYYEKGVTLLSAVAAAGGISKDAVASRALVIRGSTREPKVAVIDFWKIRKGKEPDLALQGGDIIWMPRTAWTQLARYTEAVLTTAGQAVAVQEGLGVLGATGSAGVTITAGGN